MSVRFQLKDSAEALIDFVNASQSKLFEVSRQTEKEVCERVIAYINKHNPIKSTTKRKKLYDVMMDHYYDYHFNIPGVGENILQNLVDSAVSAVVSDLSSAERFVLEYHDFNPDTYKEHQPMDLEQSIRSEFFFRLVNDIQFEKGYIPDN